MAELTARGYANQVQVKQSKGGKTYKQFNLGVKQKQKAFGNKPETVTWANYAVTDFSETEVPEKGYVEVTGYLTVRNYVSKDGKAGVSLDVKATEVTDLSNGSSESPNSTATPAAPEPDPWDEES